MMTTEFMLAPDMSVWIDGEKSTNVLNIEYGDAEIKIHIMLSKTDSIIYYNALGTRCDLMIKEKEDVIQSESKWYFNSLKVHCDKMKGVHAYLTFNDKRV